MDTNSDASTLEKDHATAVSTAETQGPAAVQELLDIPTSSHNPVTSNELQSSFPGINEHDVVQSSNAVDKRQLRARPSLATKEVLILKEKAALDAARAPRIPVKKKSQITRKPADPCPAGKAATSKKPASQNASTLSSITNSKNPVTASSVLQSKKVGRSRKLPPKVDDVPVVAAQEEAHPLLTATTSAALDDPLPIGNGVEGPLLPSPSKIYKTLRRRSVYFPMGFPLINRDHEAMAGARSRLNSIENRVESEPSVNPDIRSIPENGSNAERQIDDKVGDDQGTGGSGGSVTENAMDSAVDDVHAKPDMSGAGISRPQENASDPSPSKIRHRLRRRSIFFPPGTGSPLNPIKRKARENSREKSSVDVAVRYGPNENRESASDIHGAQLEWGDSSNALDAIGSIISEDKEPIVGQTQDIVTDAVTENVAAYPVNEIVVREDFGVIPNDGQLVRDGVVHAQVGSETSQVAESNSAPASSSLKIMRELRRRSIFYPPGAAPSLLPPVQPTLIQTNNADQHNMTPANSVEGNGVIVQEPNNLAADTPPGDVEMEDLSAVKISAVSGESSAADVPSGQSSASTVQADQYDDATTSRKRKYDFEADDQEESLLSTPSRGSSGQGVTPSITEAIQSGKVSDLSLENPPEHFVVKRTRGKRIAVSSPESGRVLRKRREPTEPQPLAEESQSDSMITVGPVSDFEFTGSSAVMGRRARSEDFILSCSSSTSLRGILKKQYGTPQKRHLAFIDESAEDRQKLAEDRRLEVEASRDPAPVPSLLPVFPSVLAEIPSQVPRVANLRILSWNIAGLSAFLQKNTWREINAYLPDIICLQETKVQSKELLESLGVHVGTAYAYFASSAIKGHGGVAILCKNKPVNTISGFPRTNGKTFAEKGHVITAEFEKFFIVNAYVPNSSLKLKNLEERLAWDVDFRAFLKSLQEKKPVILAGDLNCARLEIDLFHPDKNRKNAGFTNQERDSLATTMNELKLIDVFRSLYPDVTGSYTFWTHRSQARMNNIGWRLDCFLVSEVLKLIVCDIRHFVEIGGSDHCPIMLYLDCP